MWGLEAQPRKDLDEQPKKDSNKQPKEPEDEASIDSSSDSNPEYNILLINLKSCCEQSSRFSKKTLIYILACNVIFLWLPSLNKHLKC